MLLEPACSFGWTVSSGAALAGVGKVQRGPIFPGKSSVVFGLISPLDGSATLLLGQQSRWSALQDHRWDSCRTGLVWVRPPSKKGCAAAALICSRLGISNSDAVCGCDAGQVSMYRCLRAVHETRIHKGSLSYQVRSRVVAKIR